MTSKAATALLEYSICAVRGATEESLRTILDVSRIEAFVMAFHVRNIRGGRGERDVFKTTMHILYRRYPETTLALLDRVPHYGCWKDLYDMSESIGDPVFTERVVSITATQLLEDMAMDMKEKEKDISLCAKWAPRERKKKNTHEMHLVRLLGKKMFPDRSPTERLACYRQMVSRLNRQLKTVEIQMCSDNGWADIDPKDVPARAKQVYSRAFLNLVSTTFGNRLRILSPQEKHQLRFPDNADRMACRERFAAVAATAAVAIATESEVLPASVELLRMELDAPQYDLVRSHPSLD